MAPTRLCDAWPHIFNSPEEQPESQAEEAVPVCCPTRVQPEQMQFMGMTMPKQMYKLMLFMIMAMAAVFMLHNIVQAARVKALIDTATQLMTKLSPGVDVLKGLLQ